MSVVSYYDKRGEVAPAGHIEPLAAMELDEIRKRSDEFRRIGLDAIRAGKVGAFFLREGWAHVSAPIIPRECTI